MHQNNRNTYPKKYIESMVKEDTANVLLHLLDDFSGWIY